MQEPLPINPVVIAPTFNNARTLGDVLRRIAGVGVPVIVVNDGSTDATPMVLQTLASEGARLELVTHPHNRGKAAALRSGFARAAELGYTHAATIDTDGQLDPAEIPALLREARKFPDALVLGCRKAHAADYPKKSRLGRRVSNLLVRWESGANVADSQCGFRVYPLNMLRGLSCCASRYGFETEVLARAAWAGVPIRQIGVACIYELPGGRVSHFRPWRDSLAAVAMHARLMCRSALPWSPSSVSRTGEVENQIGADAETGTIWRRIIRWISPLRAWRLLRHNPGERSRFAVGLALGVFIANLPLYGVQTLLSLVAARRLRLNPLAVVVGSHFSTPPIGPLLVVAAITLGHWLTHGTLPVLRDLNPQVVGYGALFKSLLIEWTIGGVVIGAALAGITYGLAHLLMPGARRHTREVEAAHRAERAPSRDREAVESAV